MSSNTAIQLVLQSAATGARISIPNNHTWAPSSTLAQVMETVRPQLELVVNLQQSSIRYVQTTVPFQQWSSTKLRDLNISSGRTLLILQTTTGQNSSGAAENTTQTTPATSGSSSALQDALATLYQNNFDADTKACIVTLCKVLDNVIQKPHEPIVRTIRLANPAFSKKVAQRKGGVEYLVACGFQRQQSTAPILSRDPGEEILVLPDGGVDTSHLVRARKLLMTEAIQKLGMTADDLPKYKPPPPSTASARSTAASSNSNNGQFDVYRGHRFDAKSAAAGKNLGPDGKYVSSTETQLKQLQSKQARLEAKQQPLQDREIVAMMPNTVAPVVAAPTASSSTKGDGSLLAQQMKRQQAERKQREEGGFTTKAMRAVQQLQNQKVYSHATLRIQFPDGCSLSAKFLPKESIQTVKDVIIETMTFQQYSQFDLYIAPPRRKLPLTSTLQQEGLVPAAKVFVSWVGAAAAAAQRSGTGSYLKRELYQTAGGPAFPTGQALTTNNKNATSGNNDKKPSAKKRPNNKEDDLLRRMMGGGGGGGLGGGGSSSKKGSGKPKWFK